MASTSGGGRIPQNKNDTKNIQICSLCLHAAAVSLGSKWMSRLPPEPDSEPPTESDLAEDFERLAISHAAASSSEAVTVTPAPRFVLESRRSAAEHFPSLTILESRERPTATIYQHFSINGEEAVVLLHTVGTFKGCIRGIIWGCTQKSDFTWCGRHLSSGKEKAS